MDFNTMWGGLGNIVKDEEPDEIQKTTDEDEDKYLDTDADADKDKDNPDIGDANLDDSNDTDKDEDKGGDDDGKDKGGDEDNPILDAFDSIAETLEVEELMLVDDDKNYEPTAEGFAEMMKDNMAAQKAKLEEEFAAKEAAIRAEYDKAAAPAYKDLDASDDSQAEKMMRDYYKELELSDEEIEEKVKEAKELENLEKEGKIAQRFLAKKEAKEEKAAADAAAKQKADEAKAYDEYVDTLKTTIDNTEEIAQFKLDKKMKKQFKDYLFKVESDGKTKAQKVENDDERRLRLAFYDFMDLNMKDFEIKAETAASTKLQKKTSRFSNKNTKTTGKTIKVDTSDEPEAQKPFAKGFLGNTMFS